MPSFSIVAKRLLVAASLVLVTACGKNGITEPSANASGYLTVSATVAPAPVVAPTTTTTPTTTRRTVSKGLTGTQSGYNVPAN